MNSPIEGKPIQLIKQDRNGNLVLNPNAAKLISSLNGQLGVVAVIGPYRTGKSYIMNRLLNRSNGFELGATTDSCTRGIWMWDTIVPHTNAAGQKMNLIFMDTEGLFAAAGSSTEWDSKIFILTLLMSSMLIYNTKNALDSEAIKKLAIMTQLAQRIKVNRSMSEKENSRNLAAECPDFIWVLRDFFLKLQTKEKDYLIDQLKPENVNNIRNEQDVRDRNFIRESIKSFFKTLDCVILPVPVLETETQSQEELLQTLDNIPYDRLRPVFKTKMADLCEKIKSTVSWKSFSTAPTNGAIYIEIVKQFIQCLNENREIYVGESVTASIRLVAENELKKVEKLYCGLFDNYLKKNKLPIAWDRFDRDSNDFSDKCYKMLEDAIIGSDDIAQEFINKFKVILVGDSNGNSGRLYEYRRHNSEAIHCHNKNVLQNLWDKHIKPLTTSGGRATVDDFNKNLKSVEDEYLKSSYIGPEQAKVYSEFLGTIDVKSLRSSIQNWNRTHEEMLVVMKKAEEDRAEYDRSIADIELKLQTSEEQIQSMSRSIKAEQERFEESVRNSNEQIKELKKHLRDQKNKPPEQLQVAKEEKTLLEKGVGFLKNFLFPPRIFMPPNGGCFMTGTGTGIKRFDFLN